ncbi:MAG: asparaginase [Acidobacteriota bacterium]
MQQKSVYIAYTGGTLGMQRGPRGYRPEPGFLARQMDEMPVLRHPGMPRYVVHEYDPLLDSSNMTPRDWVKLADDIYSKYDEYDGFIVLHGTDTMAYSAAALSFMFNSLDKPIVFTGSQIPLVELRNDARENLITSLLIAAGGEVPEVCLFVGSRLLRGNRSTKTSAAHFRAFRSPNYPPLGDAGVELVIHHERLQPWPERPLTYARVGGAEVADIRFFPGMTPRVLEQFLAPPLQGAVLHTYGLGNAPDDPSILRPIRDACDRGVVIVNCTQCLEGSVNMTGYATGNALADAGVASGFDMTPEASLTKLYWLLSLELGAAEVRRQMGIDLRGEITPVSRA